MDEKPLYWQFAGRILQRATELNRVSTGLMHVRTDRWNTTPPTNNCFGNSRKATATRSERWRDVMNCHCWVWLAAFSGEETVWRWTLCRKRGCESFDTEQVSTVVAA